MVRVATPTTRCFQVLCGLFLWGLVIRQFDGRSAVPDNVKFRGPGEIFARPRQGSYHITGNSLLLELAGEVLTDDAVAPLTSLDLQRSGKEPAEVLSRERPALAALSECKIALE